MQNETIFKCSMTISIYQRYNVLKIKVFSKYRYISSQCIDCVTLYVLKKIQIKMFNTFRYLCVRKTRKLKKNNK